MYLVIRQVDISNNNLHCVITYYTMRSCARSFCAFQDKTQYQKQSVARKFAEQEHILEGGLTYRDIILCQCSHCEAFIRWGLGALPVRGDIGTVQYIYAFGLPCVPIISSHG
jgi:hypothetical protein